MGGEVSYIFPFFKDGFKDSWVLPAPIFGLGIDHPGPF